MSFEYANIYLNRFDYRMELKISFVLLLADEFWLELISL